MNPNDTALASLAGGGAWKQRGGGWWLAARDLSPLVIAEAMAAQGARLVTITATPGEGGAFTLAYHWDLDGTLATTVTAVTGGSVASIVEFFPCADWIEREIRDYMGIAFAGREEAPPLVLRAGDRPGFFVRGEKEVAG